MSQSESRGPVLQVSSLAYAAVGDIRQIAVASLPFTAQIYPGQRVELSDGAGRHARGVVLRRYGGGDWEARIVADHPEGEAAE